MWSVVHYCVLLFTVVVSSRLCLVVLYLCVFYNVPKVINIVCLFPRLVVLVFALVLAIWAYFGVVNLIV